MGEVSLKQGSTFRQFPVVGDLSLPVTGYRNSGTGNRNSGVPVPTDRGQAKFSGQWFWGFPVSPPSPPLWPKTKIEDITFDTNKYTKLTVNLKSSRNSALIPHLFCCSVFGFVESQIPVAPEFRFPPEGAPEFRLSPEGSAFRRNSGCRRNSGTDRQGVGPICRSPEGRTSSQYPAP